MGTYFTHTRLVRMYMIQVVLGLFFYSELHAICAGLVSFFLTNLIVILKLDFENTFDTIIEHEVVLEIMKHMGFPTKWL